MLTDPPGNTVGNLKLPQAFALVQKRAVMGKLSSTGCVYVGLEKPWSLQLSRDIQCSLVQTSSPPAARATPPFPQISGRRMQSSWQQCAEGLLTPWSEPFPPSMER